MTTAGSDQLRAGFRVFNRFMLLMWRLGLGRWVNAWPEVGGRIMVLAHRGRRSGRLHHTPLNYAVVNGEVYCVAGFGKLADWYRNICANPAVEVWLPDGWWAGTVTEVTEASQRLPLMRAVLVASGFAARVAGIDPANFSDNLLETATRDYRLVHIRRTAERTGTNGPGSLAWVWPLAVSILLPLVLLRRRRK